MIDTILDQEISENIIYDVTENVKIKETFVVSKPVIPKPSINNQNLSAIDKSEQLHQLKSEINDLLLSSNDDPKYKNTLLIAEKINEFYLNLYSPNFESES